MSSLNNHFIYDEESCEFIPVEQNRFTMVVCTAAMWILNGVVIAGIALTLLSNYIGTPAELALKTENQAILGQLLETRTVIEDLDNRISELSMLDNDMYRSVLGMDPVGLTGETARTGGMDPYAELEFFSEDTEEILRWTNTTLDNLERRINIQKVSFEEIRQHYNQNQDKFKHIPAIKPVSGIVLSGYGIRYHDVLQYNRQHEGLDFRADVGTPVYATGDAVVTFANRHGTYGMTIKLDHGFGYETLYAHLSAYADGVSPGKEVKRGDLIGYTGNTGQTTGPHLHYEVHINGNPANPLYYLFTDITPDEYITYQSIVESNPRSMD